MAFRVKYNMTKCGYSSIEIDQSGMTGEVYKPFKGFWVNSRGGVDRRWIRRVVVAMIVTRQLIRKPPPSPG